MKDLMSNMTNTMHKIKSTHIHTCASGLKSSKKKSEAATTLSKTATLEITSRAVFREEADRQNMSTQAVLGAKEGITESITNIVGRDITDIILRISDDTDFKGIDEY